jgi:hypothetical protein
MIDRTAIRLSAVLVAAGFIFYVVVGLLHAGGPANNHPVVFAIYASSASWTAVHLGQFVGMAVITSGLLVLYFALDIRAGGRPGWHDWELSLRRWRLGSTAFCRRWTGSRSSRLLMLG